MLASASGPKIEAAIRFAERARQHWAGGDASQACDALIRAQDAVGQLLGRRADQHVAHE